MPKTPRIPIPPAIRQYVLDRDQHQCRHCGAQTYLEIDHIIPLAQGGTNDLSNLQTLCRASVPVPTARDRSHPHDPWTRCCKACCTDDPFAGRLHDRSSCAYGWAPIATAAQGLVRRWGGHGCNRPIK